MDVHEIEIVGTSADNALNYLEQALTLTKEALASRKNAKTNLEKTREHWNNLWNPSGKELTLSDLLKILNDYSQALSIIDEANIHLREATIKWDNALTIREQAVTDLVRANDNSMELWTELEANKDSIAHCFQQTAEAK